MKRTTWIFLGFACLTIVTVGSALAFGMGNVDGVWEYIEDITENRRTSDFGGGADCSVWATGNGNTPTNTSRWNTAIQTGSNLDENQVRYGDPAYSSPTGDCSPFSAQSGFGFDGNNAVGISLTEATPFWVGRFTHYNKPILATNYMTWVDIDITVSGIVCGNGLAPNEGQTLAFTNRFNLVETPNNQNPCPYGGDENGCWDQVTVTLPTISATYTCDDVDEPVASRGTYTIDLIGLQPHTEADCSTQVYNSAAISDELITLEQNDNHACLWAQISQFVPTAVKLSSFTGVRQDNGILLSWETASEIDNLGFNLYRAEQLDGERIQINSDLIPSISPGSLFGNLYEYIDTTMMLELSNFYWLEDIDIYGKTNLHGPVIVEPIPTGVVDGPWQVFIPAILGRH